jgi:hypothetical protein
MWEAQILEHVRILSTPQLRLPERKKMQLIFNHGVAQTELHALRGFDGVEGFQTGS